MKCEECRKEFQPKPRQRFCTECAEQRHKKQIEAHNRALYPDMVSIGEMAMCEICDKPFLKTQSAQKFHVECRNEAERRRRKRNRRKRISEPSPRPVQFPCRVSTNISEPTHKNLWHHALSIDSHISVILRELIEQYLSELDIKHEQIN